MIDLSKGGLLGDSQEDGSNLMDLSTPESTESQEQEVGEVTEPTVPESAEEGKSVTTNPEEVEESDAAPTDVVDVEDTTNKVDLKEDKDKTKITENSTSTSGDTQNTEVEITESMMNDYLSEKLGMDIDTITNKISNPEVSPLDKDPYLKELVEWRDRTGRPIEDWVKYQKDYDSMPDIDIVRGYLQEMYPSFSSEEVELELSKYTELEDSLDDRDNKLRGIELKKLAFKGRQHYNSLKSDLNSSVSGGANLSPEVQADLDLAAKVKSNQAKQVEATKAYNTGISDASNSLDKLSISLSEDMSIDYLVTDDIKKGLPSEISNMSHWYNEDGSWNHKNVVQDGLKLKHFDKIVKLAYEQGLSSGEERANKSDRNITLNQKPNTNPSSKDGEVAFENLDRFLGKKKLSVRK